MGDRPDAILRELLGFSRLGIIDEGDGPVVSEPTPDRGNAVLEFAVLVTAVSVLVFSVLALHVAPPAALAAPGADTAASPGPAATRSDGAVWNVVVSSPIDDARRLTPIETGSAGPITHSVLVDLDATGQEWIGVGGAFTDAAADLLRYDEEAIALLFDPSRPDGAQLDVGRLPLSATDFSASAWTWEWDATSETATPTPEARRAVDVVLAANRLNEELGLVATPWTAPSAMVDDGALSTEAEDNYAALLGRQLDWLLAAGVPVGAVSLVNEPGHLADYPSMTMSDDQMVRLARAVRPALDAAGVDLWAVDHNWADRGRVDEVLAGAAFDAAAFHCYDGSPDQMAGLSVPAVVTECTGTDDNWTSTFGWDSRVLVAESIRAGSTGLLMWNLALPPTSAVLPGGCDDCRGLLTIDPTTGTIDRGPEFFTLAHLSRAADPGAVHVAASQVDRLPIVAFANPDGTVGVYGHNDTDQAQVVAITLSDGSRITLDVGPWEMFTVRR